ncbi:uncharacterized protein LOC126622612 [Malus sylvestris]|uniref:uncharacterized protein LOC126622612 n=1 Tax=Malus sylvestris TaxID=3752 RepID=UPI0021ACE3E0|nr:uncharacterized protein LOC126622612 [Malus sylvestris]
MKRFMSWQPGIQEGPADWDEDWDKFEDKGFAFVKELTLDVLNVLAPPKKKSSSLQKEKALPVENPTTAASPEVDVKTEKPQSADANQIRTGSSDSSQGGGFSQKSCPFTFDDFVPRTPLSAFNSGYSPPRYKDSSEPSFDTFSRFDTFRSTQDTGFFPSTRNIRKILSLCAAIESFPTFDDIPDPFGSSVPFRSSLDSQTPRRDLDPFGSSGPFRMALDGQTPRKNQIFSSL